MRHKKQYGSLTHKLIIQGGNFQVLKKTFHKNQPSCWSIPLESCKRSFQKLLSFLDNAFNKRIELDWVERQWVIGIAFWYLQLLFSAMLHTAWNGGLCYVWHLSQTHQPTKLPSWSSKWVFSMAFPRHASLPSSMFV